MTRYALPPSLRLPFRAQAERLLDAPQFPSYLEDHANTLSAEDKTRYAAQSKVVTQIVAAFEAPNYSDGDPAQGLHIVELIQEVRLPSHPSKPLHHYGRPSLFSFFAHIPHRHHVLRVRLQLSNTTPSSDARIRLAPIRDHGPPPARVRPWTRRAPKASRRMHDRIVQRASRPPRSTRNACRGRGPQAMRNSAKMACALRALRFQLMMC